MSYENIASLFLQTSVAVKENKNYKIHKNITSGTGFIATTPNGIKCLITNRHIVTALKANNTNLYKEHTFLPSDLTFYLMAHNGNNFVKYWHPLILHLFRVTRDELYSTDYEPLYLESDRVWVEHPLLKNNADFVAIPIPDSFLIQLNNKYIEQNINFQFVRLDNLDNTGMKEHVSDRVSVVGFPLGISVSENETHWHKEYFPIWTTGYIASEPSINFESKPVFLIDSRTREGNSGSPVYLSKEINGNPQHEFLGIYSGRISTESELGKVWKKSAILELLIHVDNLASEDKLIYPFIDEISQFASSGEVFINYILEGSYSSLLKELFYFDKVFKNDYIFESDDLRKNKWFFYTKVSKFNLIGLNKSLQNYALSIDNIENIIQIANLPFEMIKEINKYNDVELAKLFKNNMELKNKFIEYYNFCREKGMIWIDQKYINLIL